MPLGTEVGLGPSDIVLDVLDGDPCSSTHPEGHSSPPQFFSAHVYCGQTVALDASWYADRPVCVAAMGEAIFSACHTNPNPTH